MALKSLGRNGRGTKVDSLIHSSKNKLCQNVCSFAAPHMQMVWLTNWTCGGSTC